MRTLRDLHFTHQKRNNLKQKKGKNFSFLKKGLLLVLLVIFVASFFVGGKLGASYLVDNITPLSFFDSGKYLLVFQNNTELRSTGGFIGSYAILETENLKLKNLTFNTNIYKIDNAFTRKNYAEAPAPLKKFIKGKSWQLRDSNYDISFPEAAIDINKFYEAETGDQVDGIVAINASLMVDLLKFTGPIKMEKYHTTITADNFFSETQSQVEKDYYANPENWIQNEPKTIIKDLYPLIISKALAKNKFEFLKLLSGELDKKNVLFYFKDPAKQKTVMQNRWGGEIYQSGDSDYLTVNVNNYTCNKSSFSILQRIEYEAKGNLANLTLSRTHQGSYTWPDGPNISYIRVLAPKESILTSATLNGRDIIGAVDKTVESGKEAFGFWVRINPSEASIVKLKYSLPDNISGDKIIVQKQPGSPDDELHIIKNSNLLYSGVLNRDLTL